MTTNQKHVQETASMEDIGDFNHADSDGFLSVLGVSAKALAVAKQIDEIL